ncbi:uncharacterized protein LOC123227777 [Mangifera indica]|uniref:uncharacterized protein LOC123227777 n=1 Tax=Mangifera indica TaxID=29780 RepID=UPI001CF9D05D|nr:uncharacterized protein LOC123227777 [Mangifera indica]
MAPSYHTRSNSLPSRPHPIHSELDQHVSSFRASQATSTSSSSISHEINGLQDLHDCVDKLLQSASIQQALAQHEQKKWVDELLNGSLRLLDICGIAKDSLVQTKEAVQGLQSIFRRRRCDDIELTSEVKKYLTSRKAVKKSIQKTLKNLNQRSSTIGVEHETSIMLREVEAVTFNVIESLLSLISGPRAPSKLSSWSVVSKLMQPKEVACKETYINEFEKVDAELSSIIAYKTSKSNSTHNQLKELESNIQELEEGVDSLYRRLIKTRVSLLNILNN